MLSRKTEYNIIMTREDLVQQFDRLKPIFQISQKKQKLAELQAEMQTANFWQNQEKAVQISSRAANLEREVEEFEALNLILDDPNSGSVDLAEGEKILFNCQNRLLLNGPHDKQGAILSLHAGTGGVDAQDWAEMMLRMYLRFLENKDQMLGIDKSAWQISILDKTLGEEAGIKSAVVLIKGDFAYGLLKNETGVHRLVRLSPFNAKNLRQTSFALVEILPLIESDDKLEIPPSDLKIDVFRSSGHGGQSVNTTDSAVRITHLPTGLTVSVQNERSQHQNKEVAMAILTSRLGKLMEEEKKEELSQLRGEHKQAIWGNQIRSYVLAPYKLVKDHRTEYETSDIEQVLDGKIESFIEAELKSLIPKY